MVHAAVNSLATVAFGASWLARGTGRSRLGKTLTGLGISAIGFAGYLGGHLAYSRGVGVNTTAFQAGPSEWTALCAIDDVDDGDVTGARIDGVGFAVARIDGRLRVIESRCTHRGGPLADGQVEDGCIECPWHGSRFDAQNGAVVVGPASVPQPAYDVRVREGTVEIRRAEHGGLRRNPV
jgi:nitrite reductase/ring-hydroxylating ferredoxin subunit